MERTKEQTMTTKCELYDWYIDNCTESEIPLSFEEWEREIYPEEKRVHNL